MSDVFKTKKSKIVFLPFQCANALADTNTGQIFVSTKSVGRSDIVNIVSHDLAHIMAKDPDHGSKWAEACEIIGYKPDANFIDLSKYRKRFGIPPTIAGNIGNISGIQNMLTDYHLLMAYRKFSQRILGTEGTWEYKKSSGQLGGDTIRLFPVPKSTYPVVIEYLPSVDEFRSPQARELTYRAVLAQMKMALGQARRKFSGIPSPDGGTITFDGEQLVKEGQEEYKEVVEFAINQGEPLGVFLW